MTPEEKLSHPARVLTQAQREHYFERGYVGVQSLVPQDILTKLIAVTDQFVDASRKETEPGKVFDIGPGHNVDHPVLRRLKRPDDQHEVYWNFAKGLMADVAADLVGAFLHIPDTVTIAGRRIVKTFTVIRENNGHFFSHSFD